MRLVRSRNFPHLKKRKILGVLFDWDGTLLNSYEADATAYLAMFQAMNIAWGLEDLAQHYSPNWYNVYRAAGLHESRWEAADLAWRAEYATQRPQLLPSARTLLAKLQKHYALGLVTSGDRDRVLRQLKHFRLMRTFPVRVCSGDTAEKKPHPAPLRMALHAMRLDAQDCVYIGDTSEDLLMARRAGVRTIGIQGPFPTARKLKLARPDVLLESLQQLPEALRRMQP
ncbi:MAG TPA: HAD family hydrolase [Candidatus Dormibacteraeota bacterium]|nr:HAD family hydrolase [Candidatus Dormibacteraeota bacterium]